LTDVAQALTDLWGQHARSSRLATPILRTAEVLLSQTHILALEKDLSHTLGRCLHASCLSLFVFCWSSLKEVQIHTSETPFMRMLSRWLLTCCCNDRPAGLAIVRAVLARCSHLNTVLIKAIIPHKPCTHLQAPSWS